MRAGDMDRRVTLQRETSTDVWTPIATIWAKVEQTSGHEVLLLKDGKTAASQAAELTSVFRIRYRTDVKVLDWVLYEDRRHQIHFVRELGRQEGLELHTVWKGW